MGNNTLTMKSVFIRGRVGRDRVRVGAVAWENQGAGARERQNNMRGKRPILSCGAVQGTIHDAYAYYAVVSASQG